MMQSDRDRMMRRLGYYLAGLALGCVLVGIYFQGRQAQVARQQQAARAEAERDTKQVPGVPAAPESPGAK
ncbi:MAG: hypothetical protein IT436_08565 [Phycisphaerales bacterium]|nr:hypothetical protein [Phycisphaerales bacterium]